MSGINHIIVVYEQGKPITYRGIRIVYMSDVSAKLEYEEHACPELIYSGDFLTDLKASVDKCDGKKFKFNCSVSNYMVDANVLLYKSGWLG